MALAPRPQYVEAADWAREVYGTLAASRRTAWLVAGAAGVAATLLGLALANVAPLRAAALYSVSADDQRGYAQTVRALAPGALTSHAALTESFVASYVTAREDFDAGGLTARYANVALWSASPVLEGYRRTLDRTNPYSPLLVYSSATAVTSGIRSVSLLSPDRALVRFDTVRVEAGAPTGERRGWQAVVTFRYDDRPMTMAERFGNPLGFQVTGYSRQPDGSLPTVVAAVATP